MCGILGGINIQRDRLDSALQRLYHRGPDELGEYLFENVCLKHARLSIQDLTHGKQPFIIDNLSIVFNGEIYNHLDLRKKHQLHCKSDSDTETLLQLFRKMGIGALDELDGMFAFAIFDSIAKKLVLVRDRAGKKPLYYFSRDGRFGFSSELGSLAVLDTFSINHDHILQYLRFSFLGGATPYSEVSELLPGSYLELDTVSLRFEIRRWWEILPYYQTINKLTFSESVEQVDLLLNESIKLRLFSSDLEVGAFLSGGIDSGLVTSIARKYIDELRTFTVAFEGQYDESNMAKLVADKYKTNHSVIRIGFDNLSENLEDILAGYGEPFGDSSAIPSFYVSREAKKYLTVILNGDGADELFGGYRRYVPFSVFDFFMIGKVPGKIWNGVSSVLPFPGNKQNIYNYFFRLASLAGKKPVNCYLSSTIDTFEDHLSELVIRQGDPFSEMEDYINNMNSLRISGLRKIMCLDFHYQLPNDLLVKMDIATMANSLEGRSPFLGLGLLEFAPGIPDSFKIKGVITKYILRELARKYLPEPIVNQPKRGFEVPLRKWIDNDLSEMVHDYLGNCRIATEYVRKPFLYKLLAGKAPVPPEKRAKMLWYILALEIWYKRCYLR